MATGNHLSCIWIAGILAVLLIACNDDDLKKASSISNTKVSLTKDRTLGVELIYSDSAKVKAKGYAPILDKVTPSNGSPYNEMPKGVKINFIDDNQQSKGSITSDYAINKEGERLTIFKKNVTVVNESMTFITEELTWDENKKTYFSPSGTVRFKDGSILSGAQFTAPQDFSTYTISQPSGQAYLKNGTNP